ncbi:MAG: hypothetical protein HYY93_05980 [Planctomycetes bacterium]|nr:hypothetical protein [Planctomycetota bacterium]
MSTRPQFHLFDADLFIARLRGQEPETLCRWLSEVEQFVTLNIESDNSQKDIAAILKAAESFVELDFNSLGREQGVLVDAVVSLASTLPGTRPVVHDDYKLVAYIELFESIRAIAERDRRYLKLAVVLKWISCGRDFAGEDWPGPLPFYSWFSASEIRPRLPEILEVTTTYPADLPRDGALDVLEAVIVPVFREAERAGLGLFVSY